MAPRGGWDGLGSTDFNATAWSYVRKHLLTYYVIWGHTQPLCARHHVYGATHCYESRCFVKKIILLHSGRQGQAT